METKKSDIGGNRGSVQDHLVPFRISEIYSHHTDTYFYLSLSSASYNKINIQTEVLIAPIETENLTFEKLMEEDMIT